MKIILLGVLLFVTSAGTQGEESFEGVAFPKYKVSEDKISNNATSSSPKPKAPVEANLVEVELLRMVSPSGNEVVFSLSEKVMGRHLRQNDFEIDGISQASHSTLCQKTVSTQKELERAELKLELELLIEELREHKMPRFLSETQRQTLQMVPLCQMFKLQLTAISKMMRGYDYSGIAMTSAK